MLSKLGRTWISIIITLAVFSCARTINPNIERGAEQHYIPGYPEVKLSAIGMMETQKRGYIQIAADIVRGSLIYKKQEGTLIAKPSVQLTLYNQNQKIIDDKKFDLVLKGDSSNIVYSQDLYTFQRKLKAPPGEYTVELTLTDQFSKKKRTHSSTSIIPDPTAKKVNLTNISMLVKSSGNNNSWHPVTTYNIKSSTDSIKFVLQAANKNADSSFRIDAKLMKYETDTTIAVPMHFQSASLNRKGFDYDNSSIIESSQRTLTDEGRVLLEFVFPVLVEGNYRFQVSGDDIGANRLFKGRDFSIKSHSFPTIKTPIELAKPLAYLMDNDAYSKLMTIRSSDSLRQAVDKFWLKSVGNKYEAKSVIRLFYERVEEANRQFTNYKEGWKTDRGMIYILFGQPWYVKKNPRSNTIQWSYSHDHYSSNLNFRFHRTHNKSEFFPFDTYQLIRSDSYFQLQYHQIQRWKNGIILTTRL